MMRGMIVLGVALAATTWGTPRAEVIELLATRDNTLIEDRDGRWSNGAGPHLFAGRIAGTRDSIRRGLIAFSVADHVPPGALIREATLTLHMSRTNAGPEMVTLHRLLAAWGEGASSSSGGAGATAEPDDATWIHTFFDTGFWAVPGGDFVLQPTATTVVDRPGTYQWGSPALAADVQVWLDDPDSDHGWILLGNEAAPSTVKRFDSRELVEVTLRPRLRIEFDPPCAPDRPVGPGYWHRQCLGLPASAGGLDPGRQGRGPRAPTETAFAEETLPCAVGTFERLGLDAGPCPALQSPRTADLCGSTLRELAGLVFNVCGDRLQTSCPVRARDRSCTAATVGEWLDELARRLDDRHCRPVSCALPADGAVEPFERRLGRDPSVIPPAIPPLP